MQIIITCGLQKYALIAEKTFGFNYDFIVKNFIIMEILKGFARKLEDTHLQMDTLRCNETLQGIKYSFISLF